MITIQQGASNKVEVEQSQYPTVGSIRTCPNLRAVLGHGESIEVHNNGVNSADSTATVDGQVYDLRSVANDKG